MAYAVISGGPRRFRGGLMTFSGVASNFAGIPLALAFIFTIGRVGLLTTFLDGIGINPYDSGFSLYSKIGLEIVYLYFQLPLMILIIAPAIDGPEAGVARGVREHGRDDLPVLALRRPAGPHARRSSGR